MLLPLTLERYTLFRELASGGMATVYLARIRGAVGFGRTVAIKRLHPHLASDEELVTRFVDEARVAAYIHHPNVVPTLDVVTRDGELFLVLEYVMGESLTGLLRSLARSGERFPVPIALCIAYGMLNGLHAAHEAKDEYGEPLDIVHRDVSPQNIMVGVDGVVRVLDFGIAKAANRISESTTGGTLKGKIPYMAHEQLRGTVTRQTDIYSTGVVLWELLTGIRLFRGDNEMELLGAIIGQDIVPPSALNPRVPHEVDLIVMKSLARNPAYRYTTAHQMAEAIDACPDVASTMRLAEWVRTTAAQILAVRSKLVAEVESIAADDAPQIIAWLP